MMAHILVIDDDTILQELLPIALGEEHTVTVVADGQQAHEKLESEVFDLMIVDLYMPVMDGMQFLHEVRERFAHPPCAIVMSGTNDANLRQEVHDLGAVDFVRKPIDVASLKTRVDDALASQSAG